METGSRRPAALMVIKVWLDHRDGDLLRARISETPDVRETSHTVSACASKAEVMEQVRRWLTDLTG